MASGSRALSPFCFFRQWVKCLPFACYNHAYGSFIKDNLGACLGRCLLYIGRILFETSYITPTLHQHSKLIKLTYIHSSLPTVVRSISIKNHPPASNILHNLSTRPHPSSHDSINPVRRCGAKVRARRQISRNGTSMRNLLVGGASVDGRAKRPMSRRGDTRCVEWTLVCSGG